MTARPVLPALLVLAACAPLDDAAPPDAPRAPTTPIAQTTQALAAVDDAACDLRYVGISDSGCPSATGWLTKTLSVQAAVSPIADSLGEYCIYEWTSGGTPDTSVLPAFPNGVSPRPDCHVVGPAADLTTELGNFVFGTYERGMARPTTLPPNAATTVVAVVDTSPTDWVYGQPGGGQYEHGRSVAAAARRLSCYNGNCNLDIFPVLGLPRTEPTVVDTVNGGAFGFQSELAEGILEAVNLWQEHRAGARLVINLSVGWEGRFNLVPNSTIRRPSVRMVYDALRYARCHGALIIAAAGNKGNDAAHDDGAIFPAAFASELAPDEDECGEINAPYEDDVRAVPTDPLVVPVSGLTRHDELLHNARNHTRTPLQAPGSNVAVWDVQNNQMRPALTGSSMSSAAVSAAAATLWAYRPQTPPHVVINQLYLSGVDLGVNADVCHVQSCPTSRRVSMCTALAGICNQADSLCYGAQVGCQPGEPVAAGADFAPATSATTRSTMNGNITVDETVSSLPASLAAYDTCKNIDILYDASSAPPPPKCFENVAGPRLRPWVDPQPDPNGCDICLHLSPWMYLRFAHDSADPYLVSDAVVYLTDGVEIQGYDLGALDSSLIEMDSGLTYKVSIDPSFSAPLKEGWVEYKIGSTFMSDDIVIY